MRQASWLKELRRLLYLSAVALLLGALLDAAAWTWGAALFIYCLWNLSQLRRMLHWVQHDPSATPPESHGLWGTVLDRIYFMQKRDRQEMARLQAVVDHLRNSFSSLPYGAVMVDTHGAIEWFNPAAESLFGLRYPEDKHALLINLVRSPAFIQYFEAEDYDEPLEIQSPANVSCRIQVNVSLFGENNRLIIARDITHTHRLEMMRKDFVANVSHELRTPLTVITGYLQTFRGSAEVKSPRLQRAIDQMLLQSTRMDNLVNDLMLLSRLETVPESGGQDRVRVRPMLEELREEALTAAKGKRSIHIDCDDALLLLGNRNELRSAVSNLVMNAAKYTNTGDSIWLRWRREGEGGRLEIEDNGIGIEPQHLPRLTERFYRVDKSRSADTGGTGLGLAIVKHVLLRHQAQLDVRSRPGKGSCFTCVFPPSRLLREPVAAGQ